MAYLQMSDEVKLYYEDWGQGEVVLIIHGLNSTSLKIRDFINEFKDDYRVVFYDQRGHGASDHANTHLNVKRLGQDLHELIEALDLKDINIIGHSMGAAAIYNYISQYGCGRIKRVVAADMSPYMRNTVWKGGIGQGKWTDEDFLEDLDRYFEDPGVANWTIVTDLMLPAMKNTPAEMVPTMQTLYGLGCDTLTAASFWYSLFRTDQRPAMDKITVPFLYLMPEYPLYSTVTTDYISEHVKGGFELERNFPGTSHMILLEVPKAAADRVKVFLNK